MKLLANLLLLAVLSGLAAAAFLAHQAADVTALQPPAAENGRAADLLSLLEQSAIKRAAPLEIQESDLNRYLAAKLAGRQAGLPSWIVFEKALVDLEPDRARVMLCWMLKNRRITSSVDIELARDTKDHRASIRRGAFGRITVDRGFLTPVLPAFKALQTACEPEIKALFAMPKIHIVKDKLALDPRF